MSIERAHFYKAIAHTHTHTVNCEFLQRSDLIMLLSRLSILVSELTNTLLHGKRGSKLVNTSSQTTKWTTATTVQNKQQQETAIAMITA